MDRIKKMEKYKMDINLKEMSYQDFKKYCNDRACDGKWGLLDAMTCIQIINEIDSIKIKGLFKKKRTLEAREQEWKNVIIKQ